jgi:hypothetical protein
MPLPLFDRDLKIPSHRGSDRDLEIAPTQEELAI